MGLFDFITGNTAPDPSKPRLSRDDLYARLLALKDPAGIWHVRPADGEGRADLVAEWGSVDQRFTDCFGISGTRGASRMLLRLVDADSMVRAVDQEVEVSWGVGITGFHFSAGASRGQSRVVSSSWTFGRKPDGSFGQVAEDHWDSAAIKQPLRDVVKEAGWGWHGVGFVAL